MEPCPEASERAVLTDEEFWDRVLHPEPHLPEVDWEPDEDDYAEYFGWSTGTCVQCQRLISTDEYEDAIVLADANTVVCEECADERRALPDDEMPMGMTEIPLPSPWDQMWMYEQYLNGSEQ